MTESQPAADEHWSAPWSPAERESFFTAIGRNRRASWQVGAAAVLAASVIAVIVASLMAPLLYGLAGLLLDLLNLAWPAPDLIAAMFGEIERVLDALPDGDATSAEDPAPPVPWSELLRFGLLAALPGLLLMTGALFALHRAVRAAVVLDGHGLRVRAPQAGRLEERRFDNVVSEMAIAAGVTRPGVFITQRDMGNAVFVENPAGEPVVVASSDLLAGIDRDALQGIAAHLVASLCNGDVHNGHRIAVVTALFGLLARMASVFTGPGALRTLGRLVLAALWPSTARARTLLDDLSDPFTSGETAGQSRTGDDRLTWKHWLWMPVSGPVAMSGFFAGIVATFLLSPLLAWVWRRRRLLADATAVRLTRNPDAVARGLRAAAGVERSGSIEPWAAHLAVVEPPRTGRSGNRSFIDGAVVAYYPELRQRLEALAAQGATVDLAAAPAMPAHILALVIPLGALMVALFAMLIYLLIVVSLMLSMLFTLLPVAGVHFVLR